MRVLHTADWHIGQTLNGWSREAEHEVWFDRLAEIVVRHEIDALLVAGDVFDGINPSGAAQRLFYGALRRLKDCRPGLVTVITSGNHDPAARLEAPAAVLAGLDVHVIATVRRYRGALDVAGHMVPLRDTAGGTRAWVCAIPFLRAAELPGLSFGPEEGRGSPVVAAARRFHAEMADGARAIAGDLPLIAMGHLHCRGAVEGGGEDGTAERHILIGGEHALPADVFPDAFEHVALGHLHRPQELDGGRIRYAGSCFPLSATEAGYDHGVTLLEIGPGSIRHRHLSIPRPAEMVRLPTTGAMDPARLAEALAGLAAAEALPVGLRPFVHVTLEATGPAAALLAEAERQLAESPVRMAGICIRRPAMAATATPPPLSLAETAPEALFRAAFLETNGSEPEPRHIAAFREALAGEP